MSKKLFFIGVIFSLLAVAAAAPFSVQAEGNPPPNPEPVKPPWITGINTDPSLATEELENITPSGIADLTAGMEVPLLAPAPDYVDLAPQDIVDSSLEMDSLAVPQFYQDPSDATCGAAALGMALEFLSLNGEGKSPSQATLVSDLKNTGLLYETGTGVEEMAFLARHHGYQGTSAFHDWTLAQLQDQLKAGNPVVVSLGANGEDQTGHFVTLTGISEDGKWVSYNDPILGKQIVSAEEFQGLWDLQGNAGLVAQKEPLSAVDDPMLPWMGLFSALAALAVITKQVPLGEELSGLISMIRGSLANPRRKGLGGKLEELAGAAPAGMIKVPVYKLQTVQDGWTTVKSEVPVYQYKKIKIGTLEVSTQVPVYEEIQIKVGTKTVSTEVPNYVWKKIQIGTRQVTEQVKVTKYKTETYKVWGKKTKKVPVYKNVKFIKSYKYKSVKKTKWVKQGWRWVKKTYYSYKKVPVYGTKKKLTGYKTQTYYGWTTKTKQVPYTAYKTITKTVPEYKDIKVQQGYKTITEEVPVYRTKKIPAGYETKITTEPVYKDIKVQVGTKTKMEVVPNMVEEKALVGWDYVPVEGGSNRSSGADDNNSKSTANGSESKPNTNLIPPQDELDPELEEVPGLLEDPLGWLQGTLINAGRQNDTVKDAIVSTGDALNAYNESSVAGFFRDNTTETDAAFLAGMIAIPDGAGPIDEGAVALGIAGKALVVAGVTYAAVALAEFARKNHPLPGARSPQEKKLYFPDLPEKVVTGGGNPPPPWDNDPNKGPEDITSKEIKNLPLRDKIAFITLQLITIGVGIFTGGKEPGDPDYPMPTPEPESTSTQTATPSATVTEESTKTSPLSPTASETQTPTPSSTPTPTEIPPLTPVEIPTPSPAETQTPTPTVTP